MMRWTALTLLTLSAAFAAVGCGSDDPPPEATESVGGEQPPPEPAPEAAPPAPEEPAPVQGPSAQ